MFKKHILAGVYTIRDYLINNANEEKCLPIKINLGMIKE
jgi:hypothetical protein